MLWSNRLIRSDRNSVERYGPCLHINDRVRTEILMSQEQTRDNHFGIFVILLCFTSFFCVYLKWKGGNNVFKSHLIKKNVFGGFFSARMFKSTSIDQYAIYILSKKNKIT